jgi:hypothetical protein
VLKDFAVTDLIILDWTGNRIKLYDTVNKVTAMRKVVLYGKPSMNILRYGGRWNAICNMGTVQKGHINY